MNSWKILAIGALLAGPAQADCVMSVRLDEDPPYILALPDGHAGGAHADMAREALRRMGCKANFRKLPLKRALKDIEEGTLDIVPDLFRTAERERFLLFSRTSNKVPNRLFVRADDKRRLTIASLDDLPRLGMRLGVQVGALTRPESPDLSEDPRFRAFLIPERTHESLWRMLVAHRIDAVIFDDQTARWELARLGFAHSVTGVDFVVATAPAYFAFSRATVSPDQVRAFDAKIEEMHKDGTMSAILSSYGLDVSVTER